MTEKSPPIITPAPEGAEDYTKVTFSPDLAKFGMTSLTDNDTIKLLERRYLVPPTPVFRLILARVYDIAGCNEGAKVYLNGKQLPGTFEEYLYRELDVKLCLSLCLSECERGYNLLCLYDCVPVPAISCTSEHS
jgi:DNA topoisomerase-2